jgi:hypothetical protein
VLIEEDAQQTRQLLGRVQSALGRKEQGRGEILGLGFLARTHHRHATRVTTTPQRDLRRCQPAQNHAISFNGMFLSFVQNDRSQSEQFTRPSIIVAGLKASLITARSRAFPAQTATDSVDRSNCPIDIVDTLVG